MAEVYGTAFLETGRDKLYALMDALKTSMATGYDPTFSYLYAKHNVANLVLNAVTIDFEDATPENQIASDYHIKNIMTFSIRVHTAYGGGIADGEKNARLLNSIINKVKANINLDDGYRVEVVTDYKANEYFEESDTIGGSVMVAVSKFVEYTQE